MAFNTAQDFIDVWAELDAAYGSFNSGMAVGGDYTSGTGATNALTTNSADFTAAIAAFSTDFPAYTAVLDGATTTEGALAYVVNYLFVQLANEYVDYLADGNDPILDIAKDRGGAPAPGQSYHDNILGNLGDGPINGRFATADNVDIDGDSIGDVVSEPRSVDAQAYGDRPYFSGNTGTEDDLAASIAWDIANNVASTADLDIDRNGVDPLNGEIYVLSGGSITEYFSIQAAVDAAAGGDTVFVGPGTYNETVTIDKSITLEGPNADLVGSDAARGSEAVIEGQIIIEGDDVEVRGLEVSPNNPSTNAEGEAIRISGTADNVLIENNIVRDIDGDNLPAWESMEGIVVFGGDASDAVTNVTIRGNLVEDIDGLDTQGGAAGVRIQGNVDGVTVEDNLIQNIGLADTAWAFGIAVSGTGNHSEVPQNVTLSNNTIDSIVSNPATSTVGVGIGLESRADFVDVTGNTVTNVDFVIEDKDDGGVNLSRADLDAIIAANNLTGAYVTNPDGTLKTGSNGEVILHSTIQAAIDAAAAGDTIVLGAGTHTLTSQLDVDKGVTIVGEGEGQTTIETASTSWGVLVTADDVSISDVTIDASATSIYGVKVQPDDTGDPTDALTGFSMEDVTVQGAGRSEIDLNGVDNSSLTNVTADGQGTAGVGIAMTDSTFITLTDITTTGNNWGSIGLFSKGSVWEAGINNITFAGSYTHGEEVGIYADEEDGSSVEDIDFSGIFSGDAFLVQNTAFRDGVDGRSDDFTFFFGSQSEAAGFATSLEDGASNDVSDASSITSDATTSDVDAEAGTTFHVSAGMSIQAAIDAASDGDTIIVGPGTYEENVTVDKELTLLGANDGVAGTDAGRGAESVILGDISFTANGSTLDGFRVEDGALSSSRLAYVNADDITITNSVISGDYPTDAGTRGILTTGGAENLTVSDNLIEDVRSGIYFNVGDGAVVTGNTFERNGNGINADGPEMADISGNTFIDSVGAQIALGAEEAVNDFGSFLGVNSFVPSDNAVTIYPLSSSPDGAVLNGTANDDSFYALDQSWINTNGQTFDGKAGDDIILAGSGADTLIGGDGDDELSGGSGWDALTGGAGNDALDGGAGEDTAVYAGAFADYTVDTTAGTITDDATGDVDTLVNIEFVQFSDGTVAWADAEAGPANVIDGTGAGETLTGGSGVDIINGEGGADTLEGGDGDDELSGGSGWDALTGGAGADALDGGAGDDTAVYAGAFADYTVDTTAGTITDDATGDVDTLVNIEFVQFSDGTVAWADAEAGPANVINGTGAGETLTGGAGVDIINGEGGADTLEGGDGDDELSGGSGWDALTGGAGADALDGGAGDDTAVYAGAFADYTVDTTAGTITDDATGDVDTLVNIEFVQFSDGTVAWADAEAGPANVIDGTGAGETLTGGSGVDIINGEGGADTLEGGDGDDELSGGSGWDALTGGAGADALDGGAGDDTAVYAGAFADYTVDTTAGTITDDATGDVDTLVNIEFVEFSDGTVAWADAEAGPVTETTGDGAANTLDGGSGRDLIFGNGGADVLNGNGGDDTLDAGPGWDDLFGGAGDDELNGGAGNDELTGGAGDDLLKGGAGDDDFIFAAGSGSDTIADFEDGSDLIDLSATLAADVADLTITQDGSDVLISGFGNAGDEIRIENLSVADLTNDDFVF